MRNYISFFLVLSFQFSFSQSPLVKQWDFRFGGTDFDYLTSFQQTADGGFILGGYSTSGISGDKTQPSWGNMDYWIVKIDAAGTKQWDKRFGGFGNDVLGSVQQTSDLGYLLGGYTDSQASGDKTQPSRGMYDYWMVKTDSLGNKIWDKRYGSTYDEFFATAWQTADNGFILGGYSGSPAGGDKTQPNQGLNDYWIVKTDSIGTVVWDKTFGGTDHDFLLNLLVTNDGGYLLGGASSSAAGGDKSQNSWGFNDAWIICTDSLGNKIWDADYGSFDYDQLHSFCKSSDGGYLLACYSNSNAGGNKSQNSWGQGDVWLVKINSSGTFQWDKDLGGFDMDDAIGTVLQDADGNYFVSCNSYSGTGGDKSENNLGLAQAWVIKTDSLGNKLWDKTIFTDPEQKVYPVMVQTAVGCLAIAESSYGNIAGDKTQPNRDTTLSTTDFWIVNYCDTSAASVIAGFSAPNAICPGTCIDFTNLSVNASAYEWSFPGANTSASTDQDPQGICYANPGSYDVTLIATGTAGTDTLAIANYITVYPQPPAQGISQSGDTLSANPGAVSYQWYYEGNLIPGATGSFYAASQSGNYNVVATDSNGCEVEAAIFDVIAGIQLEVLGLRFEVYPNPVDEQLKIKIEAPVAFGVKIGTAVDISIYNLLGNKIYSDLHRVPPTDVPIVIGSRLLSPGIYFLELTFGLKTYRAKFVKAANR